MTNGEVRVPTFVPPEGAPKVTAAIVAVMKEIEQVPKSGRNKEHSYNFVEATVLTAKIQDAMIKAKLVLSPREVSRAVSGGILFLKFEFDCHCEEQAIINIGSYSGSCRFEFKKGTHDDKASAKCLTSAMKQMEIALFKIAADVDDIERDREDYAPPGRPPPTDPYDDRQPPPSDDRRGFDEADERAQDDEPEGEPLDRDARSFRRELNAAGTRDEADDIWGRNARMLNGVSLQIYNLLRDDYQNRWDVAPPKLP